MQGHGVGVMSIHEYYAFKPQAWQAITASYDRLAAHHAALVLEGAGSPAEINLKANDLVDIWAWRPRGAAVFSSPTSTRRRLRRSDRHLGTARTGGRTASSGSSSISSAAIRQLLEPGLEYVELRTGLADPRRAAVRRRGAAR